jgi:hypothetical protein
VSYRRSVTLKGYPQGRSFLRLGFAAILDAPQLLDTLVRYSQEYREIAAGEPDLSDCGEYLDGEPPGVFVAGSCLSACLAGFSDELVEAGVAGMEPVVDPAGSEGEADPAVELVEGGLAGPGQSRGCGRASVGRSG